MQAIIFDFGNVVAFFDHGKTLARLAPFTDMPAAEMYAAVYDTRLEDDFESGHITSAEFCAAFRDLCRLRCDDAALMAAVADIFEPNPEICALIPRLAVRYRLLLGSNTNPLHSRHYRTQFRALLESFHAIVLSHEIGVRKPAPGFFRQCQKLAGCPADECLFVDDLPANIEGAKSAGMRGIVYIPGGIFLEELRRCGAE